MYVFKAPDPTQFCPTKPPNYTLPIDEEVEIETFSNDKPFSNRFAPTRWPTTPVAKLSD